MRRARRRSVFIRGLPLTLTFALTPPMPKLPEHPAQYVVEQSALQALRNFCRRILAIYADLTKAEAQVKPEGVCTAVFAGAYCGFGFCMSGEKNCCWS